MNSGPSRRTSGRATVTPDNITTNGRGAEIRTRDLLNPIQTRCQTALRPVINYFSVFFQTRDLPDIRRDALPDCATPRQTKLSSCFLIGNVVSGPSRRTSGRAARLRWTRQLPLSRSFGSCLTAIPSQPSPWLRSRPVIISFLYGVSGRPEQNRK